MTQHQLNQFNKIHALIRSISDKAKALDGKLKNVDLAWYSSVVSHFDQLADLYERASKASAIESDLFNFDFDHFERTLELGKYLNQDWGDSVHVSNTLRDLINKLRKHDSPYLKLLEHKRRISDVWDDPVAIATSLSAKNVAVDKLIDDLKGKVANLEGIIDEQTRRRTVVSQSDHFAKLACQYCRESRLWLVAILVIAASAFWFGLNEMFGDHKEVLGSQGLYHMIAGRVVLVTAAFYLMRICAQNYRQCQYNRIVNLHRSRALMAFERIIGSIDGRESQSIIVSKAADAMFSHQGYGGLNEQTRGSDSTDIRVNMASGKAEPGV